MSVSVTWLGHSTVVLDLDGVRLITDPLLRPHAGLLRRRGDGPSAARWRGAEVCLLSHLHHDHAELASLRLLGNVPVLTDPRNARWAVGKGLQGVGLDQDSWYAVPGNPDISVRLTPAVHHSRRMPHRPNAANGHLVKTPSAAIWIAGDTALYPQLSQLAELAGRDIDLAVVPVGGWGPRLSGGHMGPAEAATACRQVGASSAVPVHWGTLHAPAGRHFPRGWMDRAGPHFVAELGQTAPDCRPLLLAIGETAEVLGS